jgi:hypothetical protein
MQCCDAPPLYCCNTLLKWIAVSEARQDGWQLAGVRVAKAAPTARRLLECCSTVAYTPCLRLAPMKSSRSPSSTAFVLLISTFVRRSLMRLLSSTYERIW